MSQPGNEPRTFFRRCLAIIARRFPNHQLGIAVTRFYNEFFTKVAETLTIDAKTKEQYVAILKKLAALPQSYSVLRELRNIGLDVDVHINAKEYVLVLSAFQRQFRPSLVTGTLDHETCALIYSLSDKAIRNRDCARCA